MTQETQELEFHISVTSVGGNNYLVRTEDVPQGVPLAEIQDIWPVQQWLAEYRAVMDDPLLHLPVANGSQFGVSTGFGGDTEVASLVALGRQLYYHLFQGGLRDSWIAAQSIVQHQNISQDNTAQKKDTKLRLRLGLKGDELLRLPWEVLHDGNRPIATGTEVLFSRYQPLTSSLNQPVFQSHSPDKTGPTLKILIILASPHDQDILQIHREAEQIKRELLSDSLENSLDIKLTILEQPDRATVTQELEHNKYQVFHYAGHSNVGFGGGELYLVNKRTGLTETFSGSDLAGLLANNGVKLAVFNSCRGAGISSFSESNSDHTLAEALVKRGIPAVLAMAERIPDEVALTLTCFFYRNLRLGLPIDLSLSRARQGLISTYRSHQIYWALPILYLHPKFNGYLYSKYQTNSILSLNDQGLAAFSSAGVRSPEALDLQNIQRFSEAEIEAFFDEDYSEEITEDEFLETENLPVNFDQDLAADDAEAVVTSLLRQLAETDSDRPSDNLSTSPDLLFSDEELAEYDLKKAQPPNTVLPSNPVSQPDNPVSNLANKNIESDSINRPVDIKKSDWISKTIVALIAVTLATGLGFWLLKNRSQPEQMQVPMVTSQPSPKNLEKTATPQLAAYGIERVTQKDLKGAFLAVRALLDRGALPQAKAVLTTVPKDQEKDPEFNFLNGRLIWQSVLTGDKVYRFDDARRYWEEANKNNPQKSAEYANALAFAYYREGNLDRATEMWMDVLNLQDAGVSQGTKEEDLSAYVGSSLVLFKQANNAQVEQKQERLQKAIKIRNFVLSQDKVNFQPAALSKNWLWTEDAIKDWEMILALK